MKIAEQRHQNPCNLRILCSFGTSGYQNMKEDLIFVIKSGLHAASSLAIKHDEISP